MLIAAGSCGTAAGLLLGFSIAGLATRVNAVRVAAPAFSSGWTILALAAAGRLRLARLAGTEIPPVRAGLLQFHAGYLGTCYGDATAESAAAVSRARGRAGLSLETTYTGKALAALLRSAPGLKGPPLFWNTYDGADHSAALARMPAENLSNETLRAIERCPGQRAEPVRA